MRNSRNPFRLRAAQNIESEATFLRLFGPGMLELLPKEEDIWRKVRIIRSAAGGGKTSLLRLFTPSMLLALHAYRGIDECKELYHILKELGVIDDVGPKLLGVMLSCGQTYASLSDMDFDQARKDRLLFALLNSRILLSVLRGSLVLRGFEYPKDLDRIRFSPKVVADNLVGIDLPCSGSQLHEWCRNIEFSVCQALDSLHPERIKALPGHDGLVSLSLMHPETIQIEGQPVAEQIVVLLDDVERLARQQRQLLFDNITSRRASIGTWIAERFEALNTSEMISSGVFEGRDYEKVIQLEGFWRDQRRRKRFENLVINIADRRSQAASAIEIESFPATLNDSLNSSLWTNKLNVALNSISQRVRDLVGLHPRFQPWLDERQESDAPLHERTIGFRSLEILIRREIRRPQKSFEFDTPRLSDKDDSAVKAAADLFLAVEFSLPYYFGALKLTNLSSSNIEQFLWLAGDEFEEILAAALIDPKKHVELTPDRQDAILRAASENRWNDIPIRVRYGREVRNLLEAIGTFAKYMTFRPTAPYAPGVTGIAISMDDREKLQAAAKDKDSKYWHLAEILAAAFAYNLLEPVLDYPCKNEKWMVLYLNRYLCLKFSLPLQYGGWKEKSLDELYSWLAVGFKEPKEEPLL